MNVLLLLSALLSALAGGGTAARRPQLVQAVAARACEASIAQISAVSGRRPVMRRLDTRRVPTSMARFFLVAAEPIFAARRRE